MVYRDLVKSGVNRKIGSQLTMFWGGFGQKNFEMELGDI
jgi:hypothetical protein